MKILIATDIHGSAYYAKKVVEKFSQIHADEIMLLGDIYNHGPRNPFPLDYAPMQVADSLNAIAKKVASVKGNCDSEVDQTISEFPFVGHNTVMRIFGRGLYFTHGHIYNKSTPLPEAKSGDIVFYGHFHTSEITQVDGVTYVNVGSTSLPKDGRNAYCVVDDNAVTIYDFDDNVIDTVKL